MYIKRFTFVVACIAVYVLFFAAQVRAEVTLLNEYYRGEVVELSKKTTAIGQSWQAKIKLYEGADKGKTILASYEAVGTRTLSKGEIVVARTVTDSKGNKTYFVSDTYRFPVLVTLVLLFVLLAVMLGKRKAFSSLLGLAFSILVLTYFVVPRILSGASPLTISLMGSVTIAVVSLYLAHGFNKKTTLALISTLITIVCATLLAVFFVSFARLSGTGSEEAVFLQMGKTAVVNLRGLLLGGMIIGTLGVLDDITTAQTAVIYELKRANAQFDFGQLYRRGFAIGEEHIASLINTLALAYVGASLPLLLLFTVNASAPVWFTVNNEFIAEEIIRTLVGSSALILSVPIASGIAAFYFARDKLTTRHV